MTIISVMKTSKLSLDFEMEQLYILACMHLAHPEDFFSKHVLNNLC